MSTTTLQRETSKGILDGVMAKVLNLDATLGRVDLDSLSADEYATLTAPIGETFDIVRTYSTQAGEWWVETTGGHYRFDEVDFVEADGTAA